MFYLHMKAMDFGIKGESVKAPYDTLAAAKAQAKHNLDTQKQVPLRITDAAGKILVNYEE